MAFNYGTTEGGDTSNTEAAEWWVWILSGEATRWSVDACERAEAVLHKSDGVKESNT